VELPELSVNDIEEQRVAADWSVQPEAVFDSHDYQLLMAALHSVLGAPVSTLVVLGTTENQPSVLQGTNKNQPSALGTTKNQPSALGTTKNLPAALGTIKNQGEASTYKLSMTCEFCSKSYATHAAMARHVKTHLKVKSYDCKLCFNKPQTKEELSKHMMTHNGNLCRMSGVFRIVCVQGLHECTRIDA